MAKKAKKKVPAKKAAKKAAKKTVKKKAPSRASASRKKKPESKTTKTRGATTRAASKKTAPKTIAPKATGPKTAAPKAKTKTKAKAAPSPKPASSPKPKRAARPVKPKLEDTAPQPQLTQRAGDQAQFGASDEAAPLRDGRERDFADLDYARRHTSIRDESEDEGYGRSEGPVNRRLSQMGQYAADDDEHRYGRNLFGRNRIPGAGSKRNR